MTIRHIKPDDPEFAAIAKTITPIHRVHKASFTNTYIDAEPQGTMATRKETIEAF